MITVPADADYRQAIKAKLDGERLVEHAPCYRQPSAEQMESLNAAMRVAWFHKRVLPAAQRRRACTSRRERRPAAPSRRRQATRRCARRARAPDDDGPGEPAGQAAGGRLTDQQMQQRPRARWTAEGAA